MKEDELRPRLSTGPGVQGSGCRVSALCCSAVAWELAVLFGENPQKMPI